MMNLEAHAYTDKINELVNDIKQQEQTRPVNSLIDIRMQQSKFTRQEDEQLLAIVACQRRVSFRKISQILRKPELKCHRRYLQLTKYVDMDDPKAFIWTKKDDEILKHHVSVHGTKQWKLATKSLPKWLSWECRRRFNEYIRTNRESWTEEED